MAIPRQNPIGVAATHQLQTDVSEQVKDLHSRIVAAENDRLKWLTKQRILIEQRRGIPKAKTVPWQGANNDSWPLSDGVVRRWKPGIMSLVLDSDPVSYFMATKAEDIEAAQSAMTFYHWKFSQLPDMRRSIMELADLIAQHGMAYTRQGWDYRTAKRCRIARAEALFPGGIDAATKAANEQITAQNEQLAQAEAAGQPLPPEARPAPLLEPAELVRQVLQAQYKLDDNDLDGNGEPMLETATEAFLQGAPYVKIYYEITERDTLAWRPISPLDVLQPNKAVPVQYADWVAVLHRMAAHDIAQAVKDGHFLKEAAQTVLERMAKNRMRDTDEEASGFSESHAQGRSGIASQLASMEGVESRNNNDEPGLEPIWEIFCKLDLDGSGLPRKCKLWYHPSTRTVLSASEYPFSFEEWPIVQFEFEHTSNRPYSARGICELLSTFQKQTNRLHNARLDAIQVLLSPMFKMRAINGEVNRNIRFRPGAIIPVQDVNDLQPLIADFRPLTEFLREENFTKSLAEQYIGVFDQSLSSTLSGQGSERRTAAEINAVTAQISNVFGQDATLFQTSMAEVHKQLWDIWQDLGPEEEYYHVMGEEQPRMIVKADIARHFDIVPAGSPANTNKALALARAREMLQLLGPDQSGLINRRELYKAYLDLTDRQLSKRILRTEQEAAAVQQVLQTAQQVSGGQQFQAF